MVINVIDGLNVYLVLTPLGIDIAIKLYDLVVVVELKICVTDEVGS